MTESANPGEERTGLDRLTSGIEAQLQTGGPDVDLGTVVAYVEDELHPSTDRRLTADERTIVERWINHFREWYLAYCETRALLSLEKQMPAHAQFSDKQNTIGIEPVDSESSNDVELRGSPVNPITGIPYSTALDDKLQGDFSIKTFAITPAQCTWTPRQPSSLPAAEGRINVQWKESGVLLVTVGGFLFDSDEYRLEAIWYAANRGERGRAVPMNQFAPEIEITTNEQRSPQEGDELQLISVYAPDHGVGWKAIVRIRIR